MVSTITDAVLLFALSIPVVMQYRIYPMEGTPYGLFGILFFVLLAHIVFSYEPGILGKFRKRLPAIKTFLAVAAIAISLGGSMFTAIADRARVAPVWGVHDIILQQEAAMRYLLTGKNPYAETYFETPVEDFHYGEIGNPEAVNPALYHFVMPPWYLLFPFTAYYTWRPVVGYFDGRMALIITLVMLLVAVWIWIRDKSTARLAVVLTALSPAVVPYLIEGRSDVFALSWLMVSLVFLSGSRFVLSALFMALALLSKQTIWFILPFYLPYLYVKTQNDRRIFWVASAMAFLVIAGITMPFIAWNPSAFFDSVVFYLSGNTQNSYPVSGYGLGMVLFNAGIIRDLHAYYPFILWQAVICIPLFVILLRWLMHRPTQSRLVMAYAVFLLVFWYLSRYFNNSHLGYLSMLFVLGGLKGMDEST